MIHGQGYQFIHLGRYLARAYATATLLEVYTPDLARVHEHGSSGYQYLDLDLVGLLRCCTAIDSEVSVHRQSRRLYVCWPLKGAFSQPSEAKAITKAKASYCCLHYRSTDHTRENILPEFSKVLLPPRQSRGISLLD